MISPTCSSQPGLCQMNVSTHRSPHLGSAICFFRQRLQLTQTGTGAFVAPVLTLKIHYLGFAMRKTVQLAEVLGGGYAGRDAAFLNLQGKKKGNGRVDFRNAFCKISADFWLGVIDRNNGNKARAAVESVISREIKYWSCLVSRRETKTEQRDTERRRDIFHIAKIPL